jgi:hypothetical protein
MVVDILLDSLNFYKMTKKIAVCVSGITSRIPEYKQVIEHQKKVFGEYDFFYQQWSGYPKPDVPNCELNPEPTWDYHCILESRVKPDCDIYRRYTKPGGKMERKGLAKNYTYSANQIISHAYLVDSLPKEYTHIIKTRFDTLVSTKVDFKPYIEMLLDGWNIGFYQGGKDNPTPEHSLTEYDHTGPRCKWRLFDHLLFHPRDRLKNVFKLKRERKLLGAEWGWYQLLVDQWKDLKYKNVLGGESLLKCTRKPYQWEKY